MHLVSGSRRSAAAGCCAGGGCSRRGRSRSRRRRRGSTGRRRRWRSRCVCLARIFGGFAGGRIATGIRTALLVIAAPKIGHIPARSLELKACCRQLLGERGSAAGRAHGQGVGRHFLQHILGMAAGVAFVGVDRHGGYLGARSVGNRGENAKPSIIGSPPEIKACSLCPLRVPKL